MGVVCLMCVPQFARAQSDPGKQLLEAESEFRQRQYRRTVDLLRPLPFPKVQLAGASERARARELLGAAHWYLDEKDAARQQWQLLLWKRPALTLDKFLYPKPVRDDFEKLREDLIAQDYIKRATDEPEQPKTILRVTQYVETQSRAFTFMPFGVPQFDQGKGGWGTFFATSQGLTGIASISLMLTSYGMAYSDNPGSELERTLGLAGAISGAAFYALYTWGVIDANSRYEPQRVVRIERVYQATDTADINPPQPQQLETPAPLPRAGGSR